MLPLRAEDPAVRSQAALEPSLQAQVVRVLIEPAQRTLEVKVGVSDRSGSRQVTRWRKLGPKAIGCFVLTMSRVRAVGEGTAGGAGLLE